MAENYAIACKSAEAILMELPQDVQAVAQIAIKNDLPALIGINLHAAIQLMAKGQHTAAEIVGTLTDLHANGVHAKSDALFRHIGKCIDSTLRAALNLDIKEISLA